MHNYDLLKHSFYDTILFNCYTASYNFFNSLVALFFSFSTFFFAVKNIEKPISLDFSIYYCFFDVSIYGHQVANKQSSYCSVQISGGRKRSIFFFTQFSKRRYNEPEVCLFWELLTFKSVLYLISSVAGLQRLWIVHRKARSDTRVVFYRKLN